MGEVDGGEMLGGEEVRGSGGERLEEELLMVCMDGWEVGWMVRIP